MFKWLDRRKKTRREDDLRARMDEASRNKLEESEKATIRLNQIKLPGLDDRRVNDIPVAINRRVTV